MGLDPVSMATVRCKLKAGITLMPDFSNPIISTSDDILVVVVKFWLKYYIKTSPDLLSRLSHWLKTRLNPESAFKGSGKRLTDATRLGSDWHV